MFQEISEQRRGLIRFCIVLGATWSTIPIGFLCMCGAVVNSYHDASDLEKAFNRRDMDRIRTAIDFEDIETVFWFNELAGRNLVGVNAAIEPGPLGPVFQLDHHVIVTYELTMPLTKQVKEERARLHLIGARVVGHEVLESSMTFGPKPSSFATVPYP